MPTILITGFGPFPGAPFNPTGPLVKRLVQLRRPGLADIKLVSHVFETSYAAVDRELLPLIARHKPDAILMFGLAPRTGMLRIETRARSTLTLRPDAGGITPAGKITPGASVRTLPTPAMPLFTAARAARVPAVRSHDAGRYLCNYLCWRAAETAGRPGGSRIAAFVHVPPVRRVRRRRGSKPELGVDDLARAGERLIMVIAAAARR